MENSRATFKTNDRVKYMEGIRNSNNKYDSHHTTMHQQIGKVKTANKTHKTNPELRTWDVEFGYGSILELPETKLFPIRTLREEKR